MSLLQVGCDLLPDVDLATASAEDKVVMVSTLFIPNTSLLAVLLLQKLALLARVTAASHQ